MAVMTFKTLTTTIKSIKKTREKLQDAVQEALISAAFYAMKDGNADPFNQLLDAVGNATRIKGLTMWAETFAPVIVRDGAFKMNKTAAKSINVETPEDFAEFEAEMRAGPTWYEIAGEQKVESMFDTGDYLEKVVKHLLKKGAASEIIEVVRNAEIVARVMATRAEESGEVIDGECEEVSPVRLAA